jgi:sortase A
LWAAAATANPSASADPRWFVLPPPDQSDWSGKRIQKYADLEQHSLGEPRAVIRVPSLQVAAHVYPDSQTMALEAGAAWVTGTASPGSAGNIAIAGHRDSFFRPLEGIPIGTRIQLTTSEKQQIFEVASVRIVDVLDVSPLDPSSEPILTLITCHPFRFQGYAPDRYIIRANLIEEYSTGNRPGRVDSLAALGQKNRHKKGD